MLIETALGLANVEGIAQSSRGGGDVLRSGDLAASLRTRTTAIGGLHPDYGVLSDPDAAGERVFHQADPWHAAQVRVLVACRAYGLRPIDGVYGDFKDTAGFLAATKRGAALGFDGKWAIHPTQIAPINEAFTPAAEEVERARRIKAAMGRRRAKAAERCSSTAPIDIANMRMGKPFAQSRSDCTRARKHREKLAVTAQPSCHNPHPRSRPKI